MAGRPRKYQTRKHRRKSIVLSERATFLLQQIIRKRPGFCLSRYVSERIERDFEDPVNMKKEELIELQKQADEIHRRMRDLGEEIKKEKDKEINEEVAHNYEPKD